MATFQDTLAPQTLEDIHVLPHTFLSLFVCWCEGESLDVAFIQLCPARASSVLKGRKEGKNSGLVSLRY